MTDPATSGVQPRSAALPPRRILVVKTCWIEHLWAPLAAVRERYPEAELVVWTEERESSPLLRRPDLARVILYRNIPALRDTLRELRERPCDVVVTVRSFQRTYDKMKLFAVVFFGGPGLILDRGGRVRVAGGPLKRGLAVAAEVAYELFRASSIASVPYLLARVVWLGLIRPVYRLGAFPFVLATLATRAARIEARRRSYLRQTRGTG